MELKKLLTTCNYFFFNINQAILIEVFNLSVSCVNDFFCYKYHKLVVSLILKLEKKYYKVVFLNLLFSLKKLRVN